MSESELNHIMRCTDCGDLMHFESDNRGFACYGCGYFEHTGRHAIEYRKENAELKAENERLKEKDIEWYQAYAKASEKINIKQADQIKALSKLVADYNALLITFEPVVYDALKDNKPDDVRFYQRKIKEFKQRKQEILNE